MSRLAIAFAGVAMTMFAQGAVAATCAPVQLAGDVSGFSVDAGGSKTCETGSVNNDKVGGGTLQVNLDRIFAPTPWTLLTKFESDGRSEDGAYGGLISLDAGATGKSGTFRISEDARALFSEIMVVLKGPEAFNYASFMIANQMGAAETGTYASVFYKDGKNGRGGGVQDISHLSFYGRTALAEVVTTPIPAALPLLAGALGVLALIRTRKA